MLAGAESTTIDVDSGAPIGDDKSHVLNGAVNGASTSTISQQAVTRDTMSLQPETASAAPAACNMSDRCLADRAGIATSTETS